MPTLRSWIAGGFAALAVAGASPAFAQSLPAVTIGGGLQSSYQYTDRDDADGTNEFLLNSARLYISGRRPRTSSSCSTPSTTAPTNDIGVLDAVAQISTSSKFNIWVGRFLPPSDRANLYGPYYSNHWARLHGRHPGRLSVRGRRPRQRRHVLGPVRQGEGLGRRCSTAGRRPGRHRRALRRPRAGRLLGRGRRLLPERHLLRRQGPARDRRRRAGAGRRHRGQRRLPAREEARRAAARSPSRAEYNVYDGLGGYDANYSKSDGAYILGAYLFPQAGRAPGKLAVLGKFADGDVRGRPHSSDYDQDTTEINLNYIIKEFNARVMFFFRNTTFSAVRQDSKAVGIGLQIQM